MNPCYFRPISKQVSRVKLDFKDVLIIPKTFSPISSRKEVDEKVTVFFKTPSREWNGVPIFASNMDSVGTLKMYEKLSPYGIVTCFDKNINEDLYNNDYILDKNRYCISTGVNIDDIVKVQDVMEKYNPKFLCVDVANGYMTKFLNTVAYFRTAYPDTILIAGNVVTPDVIKDLAGVGVDVIKLGIGSGSVCTTRLKTGIGYPQLSAIIDCWEVAADHNVKIMSDGGIQTPGDICKAYAAGADFVMIGSMLAGHIDTVPKVVTINGEEYAEFYGMSSQKANDKYNGGLQNYKTAEGKKVIIPLKGQVSETVEDILGGLRSCCAYLGAYTPEEIFTNSELIRVNNQVNDIYL